MQRYSPEMIEGFRANAIYADMVEDDEGKYYLASDVDARIGTLMDVVSWLRAGHKAENLADHIKREMGF